MTLYFCFLPVNEYFAGDLGWRGRPGFAGHKGQKGALIILRKHVFPVFHYKTSKPPHSVKYVSLNDVVFDAGDQGGCECSLGNSQPGLSGPAGEPGDAGMIGEFGSEGDPGDPGPRGKDGQPVRKTPPLEKKLDK